MASVSWKSGISGDWSNAADWNPAVIPGSTDNVTIGASGVYTVTVSTIESAETLDLAASQVTLLIDAPFVAGGFTFTTGILSIAAGESLSVAGGASFNVTNGIGGPSVRGPGTLVTSGPVTLATQTSTAYAYTDLYIGQGATWLNSGSVIGGGWIQFGVQQNDSAAFINQAGGTFDLINDVSAIVADYSNDTARFTNAGLLEKTGGTATSTIAASVTNTGTIAASSGVLAFSGGGVLGGVFGSSAGGTIAFAGGAFTLATANVAGPLLIDGGAATITTPLTMSGGLVETAGTLAASASSSESGGFTVTGGVVSIAAGDSLSVAGGASFNVTTGTGEPSVRGPGTLVTSGPVTLATQTSTAYAYTDLYIGQGATWLNSGSVTDGGWIQFGVQQNDSAAFINQAGGTFDLINDVSAIVADYSNDTARFINAGLLEKTGGTGTSTIAASIANTGTILAASGVLSLAGSLTGSGLLEIGTTGALAVTGSVAETVDFMGAQGTLALAQPTLYTGTINNIASGDTVLFTNQSYSATDHLAPFDNGTLTVETATNAVIASLHINTPNDIGFSLIDSGGDLALVACYLRGTQIATPTGEVPIETLRVGDAVLVRGRKARRIRWIGRRSYAGRLTAANPGVRPVCIRAGAIAESVPKRDLFVSPMHAMYLDDMLVPALALVNGTSIAQVTDFEQVDYFHLELATHDVIFAEGAASESYLDDDNRAMFQNAGEYATLYPALPPAIPRYCAKRVEHGPMVEGIRARLAERAVAIGYAPAAVGAHVIRIDQAGITHAVIPPGVVELHLLSTSARAIGDRRSLGALVLGLFLDGVDLPLADPALLRGFHQVEQHGARHVRWTNGEAVIRLAPSDQTRRLSVEVGTVMGLPLAS